MAGSRVAKSDARLTTLAAPAAAEVRLLVRPAVAGRDEAELGEAEIGHGAGGEADILAKLRFDKNDRGRQRLDTLARTPASASRGVLQPSSRVRAHAFSPCFCHDKHDAIGCDLAAMAGGSKGKRRSRSPPGDLH